MLSSRILWAVIYWMNNFSLKICLMQAKYLLHNWWTPISTFKISFFTWVTIIPFKYSCFLEAWVISSIFNSFSFFAFFYCNRNQQFRHRPFCQLLYKSNTSLFGILVTLSIWWDILWFFFCYCCCLIFFFCVGFFFLVKTEHQH